MKTVLAPNALGDNIVMSGGIVWLSHKYGGISLCVPSTVYSSVVTFYVNHPDVTVRSVHYAEMKELEKDKDNVTIGLNIALVQYVMTESWDKYIYRNIGVDFSERFNSCPIREAAGKVKQVRWPKGIPLLHDDASRDMAISIFPKYPAKFKRVWNDGKSILQFVRAIENAPEVHVIDSAFFNLTNCLRPKGKLYWHRYARNNYIPVLKDVETRLQWETID